MSIPKGQYELNLPLEEFKNRTIGKTTPYKMEKDFQRESLYNGWVFSEISKDLTHYVDGVRHCVTGPAVFWIYGGRIYCAYHINRFREDPQNWIKHPLVLEQKMKRILCYNDND